jgi:predicted transposase/invertase (TIGR01784 family)
MSDLTPSPHRPHDRFFKLLLSDVSAVQSLLAALLPSHLYQALHLPGLQLESASYVDESLQESFADLVYCCPYSDTKKDLTITFLFEHKSYAPTYLHLQLLRYLLNVWEQDRQHRRTMRLVLPIVIYHGPQPWSMPDFKAYFPSPLPPGFESYMPAFEPVLLNLRTMSDEALAAGIHHRLLHAGLFLLKT